MEKKKKKLNWYKDRDEILKKMINAELKPYGKEMNDVIGKDNWFQEYTFKTEEEYSKWKEYCINLMIKEVNPKRTIKEAEKEFSWLDIMYGLKCEFIK